MAYWSTSVGTDRWSRSAAWLSLISRTSCIRQTRPACDHPASQTSDSGKKHPNLSLTTQTTQDLATYSSMPVRGIGLQTQQPQQLDDVARWATYGTFLLLVSSMKHESVILIQLTSARHTQKLHNLVKARKQYRLSQATASAHSKQTKLELMLDFHCMFSYSILIPCL